jgi:co-chaperonin GroES (HSP10)
MSAIPILDYAKESPSRDVRLRAQGEYVIVRFKRGEQRSPGGIIVPEHDKTECAWGYVLSVGEKASVEPKYGPPLHQGQLILFNAKAGVKIDADTKIISLDDVFASEERQ